MSRPSSRASSTPGAESVNKWKIPHYYRRSSGASSHQSSGSESGTPVTPGTSGMYSPKKVLVEDPKKSKKRPAYRSRKSSKKKAGDMVFVNYTVQDTAMEQDGEVGSTPEAPPLAPVPAISHKKKSSRSRMLKLFGSSKDAIEADEGAYLAACVENDGANEGDQSVGTSGKRSRGSFLRYGRFHHAHSKKSGSTTGYAQEEVVPKSCQSPNLVKPISSGIFFGNSSKKVKYLGGMVKSEPSADHSRIPHNSTMNLNEVSSTDGKHNDENDASIAFSKMFTRNGANTGGSMSSLISSSQPSSEQNRHSHPNMVIPALKKNMSASSISSLSYRCSPVRTASPARPRSSTRGSYNCATSLHGVFDQDDASNVALTGTESYLDSRTANRSSSIFRHKKKQESISDTHRPYSTSASASMILNNNNSSAVTPSSSSLVTPPPFTPGYSLPSNTSASSTPSALDYPQSGQPAAFPNSSTNHQGTFNNSQSALERDYSSEIFFVESEIPTPADTHPALKGITRNATEECLEQETIAQHPKLPQEMAWSNATKNKNYMVRQKIENLELSLPHGSSTSSSQGASILTTSTSSFNDNNRVGNLPDSNCYEYFDTGAIAQESQADGNGMVNPYATKMFIPVTGEDQPKKQEVSLAAAASIPELNTEFDFENVAAFFQEQSKIMSPEFGPAEEQHARNVSTPIDEQASAVTSVANYSPGAAATISIEDATNSGVHHRDFDRPTFANPMMHSHSTASQSASGYSMGQWKSINNDLDAITNSLGMGDELNDLSSK